MLVTHGARLRGGSVRRVVSGACMGRVVPGVFWPRKIGPDGSATANDDAVATP
jgi:hypothetical protein